MAGKTSKFMVGLFVTLGLIITVVAIIWVGATKYFEKGNIYVTYFDESVQGLQADSIVKYRGVDAGRVEQIRVAPDNRLIAVVMKLNLKNNLSKTMVAQLKVAGITGLVYVELDRASKEDLEKAPKIGFPAEYPVIASKHSEIAKIMSGVNTAINKMNEIDTQGISNQVKSTAAEIEIFFKGKDMQAILANLKATTASLKDASARMDKTMASGRIDDVLLETKNTLKETKALALTLQEQIRAMHLPETVGKTEAVIASQVRATSENLKRVSEKMEGFASRINDRPPDLLFGKPPKKRFNE
jgi:phospholipid/cholesterol/gamma-HCH transport system substrate-binding protein